METAEFHFQDLSILCTFSWLLIHMTAGPVYINYQQCTRRSISPFSQIHALIFLIFVKSLPIDKMTSFVGFLKSFSLKTNRNENFSKQVKLSLKLCSQILSYLSQSVYLFRIDFAKSLLL